MRSAFWRWHQLAARRRGDNLRLLSISLNIVPATSRRPWQTWWATSSMRVGEQQQRRWNRRWTGVKKTFDMDEQ